MNKRVEIKKGWQLRYDRMDKDHRHLFEILADKTDWMSVSLPCDVHVPLIERGLIKEPTVADYAKDCAWVEKKSWWFTKTLMADEDILTSNVVELVMQSLDVMADIFVNEHHIGRHESAFYPFLYNVKRLLVRGENRITVRVTCGTEHFCESDMAALNDAVGVEMHADRAPRGDKRRAMLRKPQYVFGWDWAPRIATCGIMGDVYLSCHDQVVVRNIHAHTLSINPVGKVHVSVEVESFHPTSTEDAMITLSVCDDERTVAEHTIEYVLASGINYIDFDIRVDHPKLWWPSGLGKQSMYTATVCVRLQASEVSETKRFGIRTTRIDQGRLDETQRRFQFIVNDEPVFCKGANWVPVDSIYARITPDKYDKLLRRARDAGFNMLRVWGGGLYEPDVFYDKCDEYGLMIWHDFMFACALYPDTNQRFADLVEKEIHYQTRRLANRPSIVLWCGNNENHWGYHEWWNGLHNDIEFGGAYIYHHVAPRAVRENCPSIPYQNSSPYGGKHPNGSEQGDRHHWNDAMMNPVMHNRITPEVFDLVTAKFVSEYGYVGPPKKSSVLRCIGSQLADRSTGIWREHTNTFEKNTVEAGIAKHYADPKSLDLDGYLLYAGLCQGLMLQYSLESMRSRLTCYGALFWMYADCWGEIGWTIVDYYGLPKISYYFVKRAFAPITLVLRVSNGMVKVIGINETKETIDTDVLYGTMAYQSGDRCVHKIRLRLAGQSRGEVFSFENPPHDPCTHAVFVMPEQDHSPIQPVFLRETDHRNRHLQTPQCTVNDFFNHGNGRATCTVRSSKYAHAVHFGLHDSIAADDEYFDLPADRTKKVELTGVPASFAADDIKVRTIVPD